MDSPPSSSSSNTEGTERTGHLRWRRAILLLGIVNAALFSGLLPLWEGFDEAFHYGYVEELWQSPHLPVLGRTPLPYDVVASFQLAPVSNVARIPIPEAISYDAWFALPASDRERRRRTLDQLAANPQPMARGNYEAHQPPLAYLLLAPLDWSLARFSLMARVLILRLICGVGSVLLLFFGASALCRNLKVPEPFANAALFAIFSTEMLYATTAHIANDWLAVGASACFLAALTAFVRTPDRRSGLALAAWLAVGLLTKSYFPIFALFAAGVAAILLGHGRTRVRTLLPAAALILVPAAPWYIRNLRLYGNAGGTPQAFEGIGIGQVLAAAPRVNWPAAGGYMARASLWTGNNWFTSYSRTTLDVALALLALGIAAWCAHRRSVGPAERAVFGATVLFLGGVAYETCAMVAQRGGEVAGPSPWYTQVLLAPVLVLTCLGFARWKRMGRPLAGAMVALWGWILLTTWTLKLFPMYSGRGADPMRAHQVWGWWTHDAAPHARDLSLTALAPAGWLYMGMAASVALTIALAAATIRQLIGRER